MGCTGGIWKYLFYSVIHKLCVVGCCRCCRARLSDQAIADICNLPPVNITLSDFSFTLSTEGTMGATLDYISDDALGEMAGGSMGKNVVRLRSENHKLSKHLENCENQTRELDSVRERWSNLDFKYKLLMDMWALRALDAQKGGVGRSPRHSPPHRSPHHSPPHRSPRHSPPHQSPRHSPQQTPRRSPRQSPERSPPRRQSPERGPPRRSPQQSPRQSPARRSPQQSPARRSPRQSPRRSPRQSPRRSPRQRPKPPPLSPPTQPHSPHSPPLSPLFPKDNLNLSPRGGRICLSPNSKTPINYTKYSSKRIIKTTTR